MKCFLNFVISLMGLTLPMVACTDFLLQAQDGSVVVGRSMEFATHMDSEILVRPRGEKRVSSAPNGQKGLSWTARYGYVGISSLGLDCATDGMNEKGLSVGFLWMPDTVYPEIQRDHPAPILSLIDLGDWLLANFTTVEEALTGLQGVQIWASVIQQIGIVPPLHLALHDKQGKSAVVEFIDGAVVITDNPSGVLTNAPKIEWHLTNLRNYLNLSSIDAKPLNIDGSVLNPTGKGSGLLGIPGDWTPPSRFVRMAIYKQIVAKAKSFSQNVNLAFHLLNTVDIPYGAVKGEKDKDYDYTQWAIVKDLSNGILYFRTYDDLQIRTVHLPSELKGSQRAKRLPMRGSEHIAK